MSTNLGSLGAELDRVVASLLDTTASGAVAAAVAGQLGRAIEDLATRGFMKDEFLVRRDMAAMEVSRACKELAANAPSARGRAIDIAGAMADASGVISRSISGYQRWAVASALCDHLELAVDVTARVSTSGTGASLLTALASERVIALQRLTTAHPARRADNVVLEHPIAGLRLIPATAHPSSNPQADVNEAVAQLSAAAAPESGLWSVEETLAVALAGEQISAVMTRDADREPLQFWPKHVTATDSWRLVVAQLSRLEQPDNPVDRSDRVSIAAIANDAAAAAPLCSVGDLADASQQLPALASFASLSVGGWQQRSPVFTVNERGDRSALIRLNAAKLRPLQRTLDDTRGLAVGLADRAGRDNPVALRRTWLHHHEAASTYRATDERGEAQARVHAALTRPASPPRGRAR